MLEVWPEVEAGIYSAGLNRRDLDHPVLFASIDSVWNKAAQFPRFDCIIVDEAHRIPARGEGKYRTFLRHFPRAIVVGFTATPYRMGAGAICHRDHILNRSLLRGQRGRPHPTAISPSSAQRSEKISRPSGVKRHPGATTFPTAYPPPCRNFTSCGTVTNAVEILARRRSAVGRMVCVDVAHCAAVRASLPPLASTPPP